MIYKCNLCDSGIEHSCYNEGMRNYKCNLCDSGIEHSCYNEGMRNYKIIMEREWMFFGKDGCKFSEIYDENSFGEIKDVKED